MSSAVSHGVCVTCKATAIRIPAVDVLGAGDPKEVDLDTAAVVVMDALGAGDPIEVIIFSLTASFPPFLAASTKAALSL